MEMGSRRTHEQAAVAAARAAYVAGFAATSNLEAGRRYGIPDRRHRARTRSPCCTTTSATAFAAQVAALGRGHDAAGRHLRRRRRRCGRRSRSPGTELGAVRHRLRRPARAGPRRCARSSTSSAPPTPGSWSPATSTSTRSPRSPRPRSTPTASAPRWSPAAAHPTAGLVYKLVAREGADGALIAGGQDAARARSASAAASGRCAGADAGRRRRGRGRSASAPAGRRRRRPRRCSSSSCATARSSAREPLDGARARHAAPWRSCRHGAPALPRRAGDPDAC